MSVTFESYERRIDQIKPVMEKYGIKDFDDALKICTDKGFNPYDIVKGVQPICFENAAWAYTLGAAIAIKKGDKKAADAAKSIVDYEKGKICFIHSMPTAKRILRTFFNS